MAEEKMEFQAEVSKVLGIVINSLYSNKEIFLRELISNASDACDKLRYLSLTDKKLAGESTDPSIKVSTVKKDLSITVEDNGIGMNKKDLIANLGTIARSGTTAFLENLSGDEKKDTALIGQFGVGFYASFSVAEKVEVLTRKAGGREAWLWTSDGKGSFTIDKSEKEKSGTSITLFLKKEDKEFIEEVRIRNIVRTYSDHISIPIMIATKDGEEQINTGSALWTRQKKDITPEQYKEFYNHVGHMYDEPWLIMHNRAEGKLEYTNLIFVPSTKPFDLMNPDRKHQLQLYVKRVFITGDCEELMPAYLRFIRGIVDSEDLPLNVSREMLQRNPVVNKIRGALIKRVFNELQKKADKSPSEYAQFWENFGSVLKEGLYEDHENREKILNLVKFKSTNSEDMTSLKDYIERMKKGQDNIFYISGDDIETLRNSPQLEGFKSKNIEVLFMTDPVDEFWLPMVGTYEEKSFTSVTSSSIDLSKIKDAKKDKKDSNEDKEKANDSSIAKLIIDFKETLGETVKDVKSSDRLVESAVCLVAGEGDMDLHLERMLKSQGHVDTPSAARILEINPSHPLIIKLSKMAGKPAQKDTVKSMALILLDEACIIEGQTVSDPSSFSERLNMLLEKSF